MKLLPFFFWLLVRVVVMALSARHPTQDSKNTRRDAWLFQFLRRHMADFVHLDDYRTPIMTAVACPVLVAPTTHNGGAASANDVDDVVIDADADYYEKPPTIPQCPDLRRWPPWDVAWITHSVFDLHCAWLVDRLPAAYVERFAAVHGGALPALGHLHFLVPRQGCGCFGVQLRGGGRVHFNPIEQPCTVPRVQRGRTRPLEPRRRPGSGGRRRSCAPAIRPLRVRLSPAASRRRGADTTVPLGARGQRPPFGALHRHCGNVVRRRGRRHHGHPAPA